MAAGVSYSPRYINTILLMRVYPTCATIMHVPRAHARLSKERGEMRKGEAVGFFLREENVYGAR